VVSAGWGGLTERQKKGKVRKISDGKTRKQSGKRARRGGDMNPGKTKTASNQFIRGGGGSTRVSKGEKVIHGQNRKKINSKDRLPIEIRELRGKQTGGKERWAEKFGNTIEN